MIDLTQIICALIALISAIISAFLIPLIRAKVSKHDLEEMEKWVDIAVRAAEQTLELAGDKKKFVVARLESLGYTIDDTVLDAIEAAVLNLHKELYGEWEK